MKTIKIVCESCKLFFEKELKHHKSSLKKNPNTKFFCSKACQWNSQIKRDSVSCDSCGIKFDKRLSEIGRSAHNFCSRSCAATFNNKISPKKTHFNRCVKCGEITDKPRARYCEACRPVESKLPRDEKTIEEMVSSLQRAKYSYIRKHAREQVKDRKQICIKCGYSKHVEACHIKGVGEFPKETKLKEVNNPQNLILLCPNCHWEFDNKLFSF